MFKVYGKQSYEVPECERKIIFLSFCTSLSQMWATGEPGGGDRTGLAPTRHSCMALSPTPGQDRGGESGCGHRGHATPWRGDLGQFLSPWLVLCDP